MAISTPIPSSSPPRRWTSLAECHERYCAGPLIEAAVAYGQATGKAALLDIARRLPDGCPTPAVRINDEPVDLSSQVRDGYCQLHREWRSGDRVVLDLPMPVQRLRAQAEVRQLAGKVALPRGPLVYCLEQVDNGAARHDLSLPPSAEFHPLHGRAPLPRVVQLEAEGQRWNAAPATGADQSRYRHDAAPSQASPQRLTFIPYFAWANRGEGEMRVGVDER